MVLKATISPSLNVVLHAVITLQSCMGTELTSFTLPEEQVADVVNHLLRVVSTSKVNDDVFSSVTVTCSGVGLIT